MPSITFVFKDGTEKEVDAPIGLSVMEIAIKNDIDPIEGACGGSLACATCHAYIHPDFWDKCLPEEGEVSEDEEDMLDLAFDLKKQSRLTCQIIMREDLDGMTVVLPGGAI
ncbi:MAG: 2Fe-2S iron-sulfur cluster-binding protein [Pseudomonadota bacterium]